MLWNLRSLRKRLGKCRGTQRSLRKRLSKCRGTCATCANVSVNAAVFAQPAQTSRQIPGASRSLRKRLGKCREPRATCANVSANAAELARLAQTWGRWGAYAVAPLQPDGKLFQRSPREGSIHRNRSLHRITGPTAISSHLYDGTNNASESEPY